MDYCFNPIIRNIGALFADTITQTTVSAYTARRMVEKPVRTGGRYADKPVGEATISKELRMLCAALNWAGSEQLIALTPVFRIEVSAGASRSDWLTKTEASLLMGASAPHLSLFILIALSTAKRREAILSLKWENVSLSRPGHEFLDFGENVGNKKKGSTPISGNSRLIEALREAQKAATSPYVVEYRGDRIKDVKTALTAACKRAKVQHIGAHTLKHTAMCGRPPECKGVLGVTTPRSGAVMCPAFVCGAHDRWP